MSSAETTIQLKLHEVTVLYGKRVAIDGRLGGMNRRDFTQLVASKGGKLVEASDPDLDLIVVGAESETPKQTGTAANRENAKRLHETELWESLGYIESHREIGRLYTPAMLAELLEVPVSTVRRWHRRGLIQPVRQVKKLPYFDFEEVASARHIARLIQSGHSPAEIETKLSQLATSQQGARRPLSQLSVIVEGKDVLMRKGNGLVETSGQQMLPFGSLKNSNEEPLPELLPIRSADSLNDDVAISDSAETHFDLAYPSATEVLSADELVELAIELEDEGDLAGAIECYRTILMASGPSADIAFRMAELLYQSGDLTAARERYYIAIELEPSFVEARASLGCVLRELGENELAISAFQGALQQHQSYPDVHFYLARSLADSDRGEEAREHWQAFLQLAPKSPWAEEARQQLLQHDS